MTKKIANVAVYYTTTEYGMPIIAEDEDWSTEDLQKLHSELKDILYDRLSTTLYSRMREDPTIDHVRELQELGWIGR